MIRVAMIRVAAISFAIWAAAWAAHSAYGALAGAGDAAHVAAAQQTLDAAMIETQTYYVDHSAPPPVDLLGRATPYGLPLDDGGYGLVIQASPGGDAWTIVDTRRYRPAALAGLRRWDGVIGDAPSGTCGGDAPCTRVARDASAGIVGAP